MLSRVVMLLLCQKREGWKLDDFMASLRRQHDFLRAKIAFVSWQAFHQLGAGAGYLTGALQ